MNLVDLISRRVLFRKDSDIVNSVRSKIKRMRPGKSLKFKAGHICQLLKGVDLAEVRGRFSSYRESADIALSLTTQWKTPKPAYVPENVITCMETVGAFAHSQSMGGGYRISKRAKAEREAIERLVIDGAKGEG